MVDDLPIEYTYKKTLLRKHYNVYFEYEGVSYYLYFVTSGNGKFKEIMYEFVKDKMY